ncbi:peroxisomal membrane protein PEX16-like isoform X1 [Varroa jacobsoni]|uniref:peroxisomal membrane protein PEX16-like isoform X1 n=1 Tax=Varroa jacobsoni TaxID=62625 RepID=UPI000BF9093C|nr:peroxisomal membrane protein PEX16-like isoform X1 [Varroa jacobsoni]
MKISRPQCVANSYVEYVCANPNFMQEIESALKWASFLITNRFQYSNVVAEFLSTGSNLLMLANDIILRRAYALPVSSSQIVTTIRAMLQVFEYSEVFFETSARTLSGEPTKWIIIGLIQLIKTVLKLVLLFGFKQGMNRSQAVPPLNRKADLQYADKLRQQRVERRAQSTFILKSGREVRSLENTPPINQRRWCETQKEDPMSRMEQKYSFVPSDLNGSQIVGEVLHIMRPLVHLFAIRSFGLKSWAPWAIALSMDVSSIQLLRAPNLQHLEQLEMSRRTMVLLLYLLRSPFYDQYTKSHLMTTLRTLADSLPFIRLVLNPIIDYIPEWQKTYFYNWS